MRKIISVFMPIIFLISLNPLCAQWAKTYGKKGDDRAYSVRQASDGGYIVVGYTTSFGVKGKDIWVLKLDLAGDVKWQKALGDDGDDQARSVLQSPDGGFVLAGGIHFGGYGYYPDDFWLCKLDRDGNVVWQEFQGDVHPHYHSEESAYSVCQTSDGGYIAAGQRNIHYEEEPRSFRFNILKINSGGQSEWQKFYGSPGKDDKARSIQETSDGGYIVAGSTKSFGVDREELWILKLDSQGRIEWEKAYGGQEDEYAESIQQTSDGGYVVAGVTNSFGAGGHDFWILKLNPEGLVEWEYTYGGPDGDYAHEIHQTKDRGYVVIGGTRSFGEGEMDFWVLKLNSRGGIKWERAYGGREYDSGFSVRQTNEKGYIAAGATESFGEGNKDVFVLKLGPGGEISDVCRKYMNKTRAQVFPSAAVLTITDSGGGGGMFEHGETFFIPKNTDGILNDVCRPEELIILTITTTNGGTTDPIPGTYTHSVGTEVEVQALADDNYEFREWTGDITLEQKDDNPVTIVMDTSKAIRAHFGRKYILAVSSSNWGTTDPLPDKYTYAAGTEVTVSAVPDPHCEFLEWSGNTPAGLKYNNPITFIMNGDKFIRANFVKIIYAPLNFSGQKVLNRSLSQIEYINVLSWIRNPDNRDITRYRIYTMQGASRTLQVELDAVTFDYWHRNLERDGTYIYALVAVDDEDREGEAATIVLR